MLTAKAMRIMMIAGEASADLHGANLARALVAMAPSAELFGVGGPAMRAAGVRVRVDAEDLGIVGFTEAIRKLAAVSRALAAVKAMLRRKRPDLLIIMDMPDFNLHAAGVAKTLNIPVLYYICPQIWAWRTGRVRKIRKRTDRLAVIFPFEETFYRKHGIPADFVGHPLMDASPPEPVPWNRSPGKDAPPAIGLLPGSRECEVVALLPVMAEAVRRIAVRYPGLRVMISKAPTIDHALPAGLIAALPDATRPEIVDGPVESVFRRCRLTIAASGTVTLEAALCGIPTIILYKLSPVNYRIAQAMIRTPFVGLPNLIAGDAVMPELIQDDATPEKIAREAIALLETPGRLNAMHDRLLDIRRKLGGPGASARTAAMALDMIRRARTGSGADA